MSVAINVSGLLAPAVKARGDKGGDNSKAAAAFDSMLGAPSGRDAGKSLPAPAEGKARPAWTWSRPQQPPENAVAPAGPRDATATTSKAKTDPAGEPDVETAVEEDATPIEIDPESSGAKPNVTPEPLLGTGNTKTDLTTSQPASQFVAGAPTDDGKSQAESDASTESRSRPTLVPGHEDGQTIGKDRIAHGKEILGREMAPVARPDPGTAAGTTRQAMQARIVEAGGGAQVTDAGDSTEGRTMDSAQRPAMTKPAIDASFDRAGLERPPIASRGEARADLRTRPEAPRIAPATSTAAQRTIVTDASAGPVVGDPDTEARPIETRDARSAVPAAQLRQGARSNDPFAQRVTVVSSQTAPVTPPAPAHANLAASMPSAQVVTAIREEAQQISRAAAAAMEVQDFSPARSRPLHTIQIQLQPVDLGRVTARMTMEGTQLRVELQVETSQARAQLTHDADSLLKSLKASGFEIERVTVQQVQPGGNAPATAGQERGGNPLASQNSGSDEAGEQRRQGATGGDKDNGRQEGNDGTHQNAARGGLFI